MSPDVVYFSILFVVAAVTKKAIVRAAPWPA